MMGVPCWSATSRRRHFALSLGRNAKSRIAKYWSLDGIKIEVTLFPPERLQTSLRPDRRWEARKGRLGPLPYPR